MPLQPRVILVVLVPLWLSSSLYLIAFGEALKVAFTLYVTLLAWLTVSVRFRHRGWAGQCAR